MPRITKAALEAAKVALAEAIAAAILARPFDPSHAADSPQNVANLSEEIREGIAAELFADYVAKGLSADDCRAKYGGQRDGGKSGGLTGHRRRAFLRQYGYGSAVAKSYSAYSDGAPRTGSSHARTHGPLAAERAAQIAAEQEAAEQAEQDAAAAALRAAGKRVPRDPAKRLAAAAKLSA